MKGDGSTEEVLMQLGGQLWEQVFSVNMETGCDISKRYRFDALIVVDNSEKAISVSNGMQQVSTDLISQNSANETVVHKILHEQKRCMFVHAHTISCSSNPLIFPNQQLLTPQPILNPPDQHDLHPSSPIGLTSMTHSSNYDHIPSLPDYPNHVVANDPTNCHFTDSTINQSSNQIP